MSKKFLEINFSQTEPDQTDGLPPELIRLAVSHEEEAKALYDKLDPEIITRPHVAHLHECNHSATGNAPCSKKQIAEVKEILQPAPVFLK